MTNCWTARLGVDPRHTGPTSGTTVLPHGTGRSVRVTVLAKGDKVKKLKLLAQTMQEKSPYEKIQQETGLNLM